MFKENKKHFFEVILFIILFSFSGTLYIYAVPPATPYLPSDATLDPNCVPGSINCIVSTLPNQDTNSGKFLTTDGTNTSWGTVTSLVPTDNILHWDSINKYYAPFTPGNGDVGIFYKGSTIADADNILNYTGGFLSNGLSNNGISGFSTNGFGTYGNSTNNTGIYGQSGSSYGGYFRTNTGTKIAGFDYNSNEKSYIDNNGAFVSENTTNGIKLSSNTTFNGQGLLDLYSNGAYSAAYIKSNHANSHGITIENTGGVGLYIASYSSKDALNIMSGGSGLPINITNSGGISKTILNPTITNGASAIAYTFDTESTLSTIGAKLFSILNNTVEKFNIDKDGSITSAPLVGVGNRAVYSDASGVLTNSASDARLKKNVVTISNNVDVLSKLQDLRGVYYNWDTSKKDAANLGSQREMGMIAQEVQAVLPELIGKNSTGYLSIDYPKLTAYLIEVAKAQEVNIKNLSLKVKYLLSLDTTITNSLGSLIKQFLENKANGIKTVFFGQVNTKKLCLEDLCITKDQLQQVLNESIK